MPQQVHQNTVHCLFIRPAVHHNSTGLAIPCCLGQCPNSSVATPATNQTSQPSALFIASCRSDADTWLHLFHPYRCPAVSCCLQNADYSPELTGLLNQQATWQMLELQPQLKQLLGGSAVKVAPASNVGKRTEEKNIGVPSKSLRSSAGGASCGGWRSAVAAFAAVVLAHVVLGA